MCTYLQHFGANLQRTETTKIWLVILLDSKNSFQQEHYQYQANGRLEPDEEGSLSFYPHSISITCNLLHSDRLTTNL